MAEYVCYSCLDECRGGEVARRPPGAYELEFMLVFLPRLALRRKSWRTSAAEVQVIPLGALPTSLTTGQSSTERVADQLPRPPKRVASFSQDG